MAEKYRNFHFHPSGAVTEAKTGISGVQPNPILRPPAGAVLRPPEHTAKTSRGKIVAVLGVLAVAAAGVTAAVMLREKGPTGSELLEEMKKFPDAKDAKEVRLIALKQVAAGNVPDFPMVTIQAKSKAGTVVEFEANPSGQRIGSTDDFIETPLLDGPTAQAICELQGLALPTKWMGQKIREQAFANGGKVRFIAEPEIKEKLGEHSTAHERHGILMKPQGPSGEEMMGMKFVPIRLELLKAWRAEHNVADDQLSSGYFKEIIQDPDQAKKGLLATFPGYAEAEKDGKLVVELLVAANHEPAYSDYSHNVRCVKMMMKVKEKGEEDGIEISMKDFFASPKYAAEFGFVAYEMPERGYTYPHELSEFILQHK
jgi:hypothetical protein